MRGASALWKKTLLGVCGLLFGFGGGCLPEDFFADKAGEIANGLIISGVNMALADTDFEVQHKLGFRVMGAALPCLSGVALCATWDRWQRSLTLLCPSGRVLPRGRR